VSSSNSEGGGERDLMNDLGVAIAPSGDEVQSRGDAERIAPGQDRCRDAKMQWRRPVAFGIHITAGVHKSGKGLKISVPFRSKNPRQGHRETET
jgi:hypothetical protein